jgi:hypothetical protein
MRHLMVLFLKATSAGRFSGFGKIYFAENGTLHTLEDSLTPFSQRFLFDLGLRVKGRTGNLFPLCREQCLVIVRPDHTWEDLGLLRERNVYVWMTMKQNKEIDLWTINLKIKKKLPQKFVKRFERA